MIILLFAIALAFIIFYAIMFQLDIPGTWKFFLVCAEMLALNQLLIRKYGMPSEIGLVLVKSRKGIEFIEGLAKREALFAYLSDVGASISYGLLSLGIMRQNVSWKSLIPGLVILVFLARFVAPVALAFLMYVVGIGSMSQSAAETVGGSVDLGAIIVGGLLIAGGLFLLILFGIVFYGLVIFKALVTSLFFGTDAISKVSAGGDVLLPGINLPFFEGIIALAIVMAVHEGAHAVLSRIAKVPLLSSGIVLFGIIPIGAFIEPDEKRLEKADKQKQTRVLVAGPAANMLTASLFFFVLMGFFLATPGMREGVFFVSYNSSVEYRPLPAGTLVYEIDGRPIDSIDFSTLSLPPDSNVSVLTSRGLVYRTTNLEGRIGLYGALIGRESLFSRYSDPLWQSIYVILGLTLALNFVVGTVNILPVPLFDGYRIIDVNVKNKMIVQALSYGALFFFILNFLPRFFQ